MADVALRIELDRDPAVYRPGDPIAGTVHLKAEESARVREVRVRVFVLGGGPSERETLQMDALELDRGEERTWRFELPAPEGPPSLPGRLFDIEWRVQATADVPGLRDAHTEQAITLEDMVVSAAEREAGADPEGQLRWVSLSDLPASDAAGIREMPAVPRYFPFRSEERRAAVLARLSPRTRGCLKVAAGCFFLPPILVAVLIPLILGARGLGDGRWGWGVGFVVLGLAFAAGLVAIYEHTTGGRLRRWLSRKRFGEMTLKAQLDGLRRGGPLVWFAQIEPRRPITVRRAEARLEVEERMSERVSGGTRTHREVVGSHTFELEEPATLEPGEETLLAGNLKLPASWSPSLYAGTEIRWTLFVELEFEDGPDWRQAAKLHVR